MKLSKRIMLLLVLLIQLSIAEEGMYPLSELQKLDLHSLGFKVEAADIFNEDGLSLADAIVNIGGCTGSFVSPDGLILTNHHCVFRAVQAASSKEHDYINDGFIAESREYEIEAKGYTIRITDSYRDVSAEVLGAVNDTMDFATRHKAIKQKIKQIVADAENKFEGKRAEVAEMFKGQNYVLFIYTYLKDVRLVYVPPRSVGEFGGDIDNWEWPRHNADFSFLRVYAAPDGSPAEYSPDNVPFSPKKYLQINPQGVEEEDRVFILGYPGRTYRHRTSHFMSFEQEFRMPRVVDWYGWQMQLMGKMGENDPDIRLKLTSRVKGLANTEKNYRGKLQGMFRLKLVDKKRAGEENILKFIRSKPELKEKYGSVLEEIGSIYEEKRQTAQRDFILSYLMRSVNMFNFAQTVYKAAEEREKEDLERESAYMDRNFKRTKKYTLLRLKIYHEETDKHILKRLLQMTSELPQEESIKELNELFPAEQTDEIINRAYQISELNNDSVLHSALDKTPQEVRDMQDPFIKWYEKLKPVYDSLKDRNEAHSGAMNRLAARWAEVKNLYLKKDFIPDANGTFRLTFGRIRGYSPADAVYKYPITTLTGVIEKTTGFPPFNTPQKIIDLHGDRDFGRFKSEKLNNLPVGILYNMDTTGGNSGSPVLNAGGELIGLNFDRAFEATINDYAWSESYSRSIGVDIRYILWIVEKYAGADYLLEEMGI